MYSYSYKYNDSRVPDYAYQMFREKKKKLSKK